MPTLKETIEARKAKIDQKLDAIVALAETETRNVTAEEQTKVEALLEKRAAVNKNLETVLKTEEIRKENGDALKAVGYENQARGSGEREAPYRANGMQSYYMDLPAATARRMMSLLESMYSVDESAGGSLVELSNLMGAEQRSEVVEVVAEVIDSGRPVEDIRSLITKARARSRG